MAGFSTVLYQISAEISKGVQRDDVTVSVRNLTKSFGPARCGERGGWAWGRPERGGEGYMKKIFTSTSHLLQWGRWNIHVSLVLCFAAHIPNCETQHA